MDLEHLEHGADLRLRATGRSFQETLARLIVGIFTLMAEGPVKEEHTWTIEAGGSRSNQVVDLINEAIFLHDTEGVLASSAEVLIGDDAIRVMLKGERYKPERHTLLTEMKAATYHGLKVSDDLIEIIIDV